MTFSPSDHHESAGLVERFIQTLVRMARTADEGGEHWVDHLPFLLMSHRATPNRVTGRSPAELLYGRQLRLPAQLGNEALAPEGADLPKPIREYAEALNARLRLAWDAARDAVAREQQHTESETMRTSHVQKFAVDDRVCRVLPRAENKLQYLYSGPYRVSEVLSNGRYRLRDLENKILSDTFDVSQLRAYRTQVDVEELQQDEYLVDELIAHRMRGGRREFQVKWRGYSRAQSTWEPREELMRRCHEDVERYEALLPAAKPPRSKKKEKSDVEASKAAPTAAPNQRQPDEYQSDDVPSTARFARGRWEYGRYVATARGRSLRWFQPQAFTTQDLDSAHFRSLRDAALAGQATVAVIVDWEMNR